MSASALPRLPEPAAGLTPTQMLDRAGVLQAGLGGDEVRLRLAIGNRLREVGQHIVSFYLVDMQQRGLHRTTGHASAKHYAMDRLDMDERRASELLYVGTKLLGLPKTEEAVRTQRVSWAKACRLVSVVTPEHEEAWLKVANQLDARGLAELIKKSGPGDSPDKKKGFGLPHTRFKLQVQLSALAHATVERAKEKVAAELGKDFIDGAEYQAFCAELILSTQADGTIPGRVRVPHSIYKVVLHKHEDDPRFGVDTEDGRIALDREGKTSVTDTLCCDAEHPKTRDGDAHQRLQDQELDRKTPPWLRARVLHRDGLKCRNCGNTHQLHAHHIRYRGKHGPTKASNLITLCKWCHAMVHDNLLFLHGKKASRITFWDSRGRQLNAPSSVDPSARWPLRLIDGGSSDTNDLDRFGSSMGLDPSFADGARDWLDLSAIPDVVEPAWWRAHEHLLTYRRNQGWILSPGSPCPADADDDGPEHAPDAAALRDLPIHRHQRDNIEAAALGALDRGSPFPHLAIEGWDVQARTDTARSIARRMGVGVVEVHGASLRTPGALLEALMQLRACDQLLVHDLHDAPNDVQKLLLHAMSTGTVPVTLRGATPRTADGAGTPPSAPQSVRVTTVRPAPFTVVSASADPLRDVVDVGFALRILACGTIHHDDLEDVLREAVGKSGYALDDRSLSLIRACTNGQRFKAIRLVDRILDEVVAHRSADDKRSSNDSPPVPIEHDTVVAALQRAGCPAFARRRTVAQHG